MASDRCSYPVFTPKESLPLTQRIAPREDQITAVLADPVAALHGLSDRQGEQGDPVCPVVRNVQKLAEVIQNEPYNHT